MSPADMNRQSAAASAESFSHYYAVGSRKPFGSLDDITKITDVAHRYTSDYTFDPEIRWVSQNEVLVAVKGSVLRMRRDRNHSWHVIESAEYITVG